MEIPTMTFLMGAVAIMGLGLLVWSNQTLNFSQHELTESFSSKVNKLNEEILIEQVWFGTGFSNKFANITLSNISSIGITITKIELYNSTDTHTITLTQNMFPDQTYSLEEDYDWFTNAPVDVTVFTARDNTYKIQVSP